MGKNRHSKDRLYITATEHKTEYGGKKVKAAANYQALPFDHCALSLAPFETPVCTKEGVMFDLVNLVPFVRKHKRNPVTGEAMGVEDIIRLNMSKNADGLWHCPVMFKVFNAHSHIVAIRTTGNVYSFEAVNELNLKIKSFKDLLTDEPFKKGDIITLQNPDDPTHTSLRDISNFKHLQTVREENVSSRQSGNDGNGVRHNPTSDRVMQAFKKQQEEKAAAAAAKAAESSTNRTQPDSDVANILALSPVCEDVIPGQSISDQRAGGSLTSSSAGVHTRNILRAPTPDEIRDARFKFMRKHGKKGYVQLETSMGNLNLEVHCDWAPRTAWNFMKLCERGYYNDTLFHRLVPGFMVQGGDPTGTGSGGESAWGEPFRDEFDSRLNHDKRGVVSMANSGANSNGSQFFITMKATPHLDLKHSVFAQVVGGMDCLSRIEKIETNTKTETPVEEIKLLKVNVFVNPIEDSEKDFEQAVKDSIAKRVRETVPSATKSIANQKDATAKQLASSTRVSLGEKRSVASTKDSERAGVGKYMSSGKSISNTSKTDGKAEDDKVAAFLRSQGGKQDDSSQAKKKKRTSAGFDNW